MIKKIILRLNRKIYKIDDKKNTIQFIDFNVSFEPFL